MEKKTRKETKKHTDAFLYYSALKQKDVDDAMQQTADKFGVKLGTLYNWSYEFEWKERYEQELIKAREKALKSYQRKIEKAAMDNMDKTMDLFYEVASNIGPMPNSPSYSVKEFETISKLLTLLTGGATERVENNNTEKMTEEDRRALEGLDESIEALMKRSSEDIMKKIEEK